MIRKQSFWKAQSYKVMHDQGKSNSHSNLQKPTVGFRFGIYCLKSTAKAITHMVARMKYPLYCCYLILYILLQIALQTWN